MKKFLPIIGLLILSTGCANVPKLITAIGKDPSAARLNVRTIYGTIEFVRGGNSTNSIKINTDGAIDVNPKP
jgi:hypothetical protein